MKRLLSELLPYNTSEKIKSEVQKGLYEYELLLSKALEAVHHFENGDFEKFDGLVGENGCQSRAIKISLLAASSNVAIQGLKNRLTKAKTRIDSLLLESIETIRKIGKNLKAILDSEELEISLTDDEFFIFKSHLLTITKEYYDKIETNYSNSGVIYPIKRARSTPKKIIPHKSNITSRFADNLSNRAKKLLSEASVRFVQEAAKESEDPILIKMVSEEFTYIHNAQLACTPLFWSIKSLFLTAQKNRLPILLHVKFLDEEGNNFKVIEEEYLLLKINENGEYYYTETSEVTEDLKKVACIIQGVACSNREQEILSKTEWKSLIKKHRIMDIILANCCIHSQYPDQAQDKMIEELQISEFEMYKKFGNEHGFTSNNPSTFLIQHIYSAIPQRVMKITE